jgi:hypothetical protein
MSIEDIDDATLVHPVSVETLDEAQALHDAVMGTTRWNTGTYMELAGRYERLESEIEYQVYFVDCYCDDLDPVELERVQSALAEIREGLYTAEQEPDFAAELAAEVRKGLTPEPGDDELATFCFWIDPISFSSPQPRPLPVFLRQVAGNRLEDCCAIVTAPRWVERLLRQQDRMSGSWFAAASDKAYKPQVVETANSIWSPRYSREAEDMQNALEAASLLEK